MEIPYEVSARPDTGLYNAKLGIWLFLASEVMLFGALFTAYIFERLGAAPGTWPEHLLDVPTGLLNTFLLVCSSITMVMAWVVLKTRQFKFYYRFWLGLTILLGAAFLGIKSTEYYSKWVHWSFWVKDSAYAKYEPLIPSDMFVGLIPSESVHELRGHFHGETFEADGITPKSYLFIPDKVFLSQQEKIFGKKAEAPQSESGEEKPFEVQASDLVRATNFMPKCDTFCALYFTITGLHALHIIGGMIVMSYFWGPGVKLYRKNPEHMANRIEVFGIFWHFVDLVWISAFPILYLF